MKRTLLLCALCLLGLGSVVHAQDWRVALPKAAPGTIITVPAGTFGGAVTVPPGVTLRGAGYALTTLDLAALGLTATAVTLYYPWQDGEGEAVIHAGRLSFPPFTHGLVFRVLHAAPEMQMQK